MFALAVAHRLGKFSCRATLSVIRASSLNSIFSEQIQCLSEKVVTNNEFLESIEKYIPELDHADAWKASNLIATLSTAPNPGSLHDIIYMIPLNTNYLQTSAQKSSLRQDLSSSHRNPRLFQKIIAARGPNEISGFTSYGVQTVLEWARELRLSDEIWPSLCSWCATNPRWPAYEDTQTGVLIIPALAVANAYSMEAWRSLVQRYVKAFQRFHPDLYILSAVESFSKVIKLYSLVLSPTAPKEAIEAFQALNKKVVLRLQQQIKELRTEQSTTFEIVDSELISILRNSALHFRRSYALQIRYIWKRLLLKLTSLTDSTYIFVLNSLLHRAHTGKDAASNLSDKTILDWGHEYLQHYMIHRVAPFNGHVFLAFVRVMGSCQHPDTTLAVFELLSVCGTNIPLRRELLKIGFSYASTSGHTQHFNIMETICPINDEIMGPHVIRRKAHLFFNTQGKMFWEHFIAHGNMADRRLMDVAFIWLEKHSKVPGEFLWCLEQAETIWIQMRQLGFHSSPLQLESLMSMYAEIGDHKGLTLYRSVGKEMITYRVLGMAMKICVLLGYSHSSHEDAKEIWSAITPHTLRAFHRDTELRKLLLQFNPSYEHDEYGYSSSQYRRIMNPRCLLRSMPTELVTCDGLRCLLPQYSVGVDFSF